MAADLMKALLGVVTTAMIGGAGVFFSWLTRWHLKEVTRKEWQDALEERREYAEERDKILAGVREELRVKESRIVEMDRRLAEVESQVVILAGQRLRCERWIDRVRRDGRTYGWPLPPWDNEP